MTTTLLRCTICPKQPSFSDTSHLLTHVSSKGHLANLHKLQVRSHQDLAAGHQLVVYNQWFQEHGVARLLSQRLQQKETNTANKKAANRRRLLKATSKRGNGGRNQTATCSLQTVQIHDPERHVEHNDNEDVNSLAESFTPIDYMYGLDGSPMVTEHLQEGQKFLPGADHLTYLPEEQLGDYDLTDLDPQLTGDPTSSDAAQLKGVIWPGMALFDAATECMKRKRNQKKDGSALKYMLQTSQLVEPTETVYSPGGGILKQRHIDDLENDSLVEGESPLMKMSAQRRARRSSRSTSGVPRQRTQGRPRARRTTQPNVLHPRRGHTTNASSLSRLLPERVVLGDLQFNRESALDTNQTRGNSFLEMSSDAEVQTSFEILSNPFLDSDDPPGYSPRTSTKTPSAATWLKPSKHQPRNQSSNGGRRPPQTPVKTHEQAHADKENLPNFHNAFDAGITSHQYNPLVWKQEPGNILYSGQKPFGSLMATNFSHVHAGYDGFDDSFTFTRNPLATALGQLEDKWDVLKPYRG